MMQIENLLSRYILKPQPQNNNSSQRTKKSEQLKRKTPIQQKKKPTCSGLLFVVKIKSEKKQKKQFCPNKKGCLSTSFQEIRDEREKSSKLLYRIDLRAFVLAPWDCLLLLLLLGRVHVRNDNLLLACFVELFSFFSRCRLLCLCSVY